MRALVLALALAACATPARAQDASAMAPLAPLMGCWRGTFEGQPAISDERCFEPMLGGSYVRDTHTVRPTTYAGESVYFFDTQTRRLSFTYYAGGGGMSSGSVRAEGETLVFDDYTFVNADGTTLRLRGTWRFEGRDRFVAASEREEGGRWAPFMRITYVRAPELTAPVRQAPAQTKRPGLRRAFVSVSTLIVLSWCR